MNFLAEQKKWEQEHPEEAKKREVERARRERLLYVFLGACLLAVFVYGAVAGFGDWSAPYGY